MEEKPPRKVLRKLVKKFQRKRRRQAEAKARAKQLEEEENAKKSDPAYQFYLKQQQALELCARQQEEIQRQLEEAAWLKREQIAQEQFRLDRLRLAKESEHLEARRLEQEEIRKQREAVIRKIKEEKAKIQAKTMDDFENLMKQMDDFMNNDTITEVPDNLLKFVESKPNEKLCEFFERTNTCRYGASCEYNHKRPLLSKTILIRNFFTHPSMGENGEVLSENDASLENTERDIRRDYDEFFFDIVPELNKFGKILNLRCVRNVHKHLRGNVFVEYENERSALKAFSGLHGRYYASRQLNVEFSNLKQWRGAICGMFIVCLLKLFQKNPDNKYNTPLEFTKNTANQSLLDTSRAKETPSLSWNDENDFKNNKNWRWSESPESELESERFVKSRKHKKGRDICYQSAGEKRDEKHSKQRKGSFFNKELKEPNSKGKEYLKTGIYEQRKNHDSEMREKSSFKSYPLARSNPRSKDKCSSQRKRTHSEGICDSSLNNDKASKENCKSSSKSTIYSSDKDICSESSSYRSLKNDEFEYEKEKQNSKHKSKKKSKKRKHSISRSESSHRSQTKSSHKHKKKKKKKK